MCCGGARGGDIIIMHTRCTTRGWAKIVEWENRIGNDMAKGRAPMVICGTYIN